MKLIPLLLGVLLFFALAAQAEIYRWTDDQGRVHFGDKPPESKAVQTVKPEINSISLPAVAPQDFLHSREEKAAEGTVPRVVMYSTEWCGYCKKARAYFRQRGISFHDYDVEKSAKGKRDYQRMNGSGVPIILVGEQRMQGFSAERFEQLYSAAR